MLVQQPNAVDILILGAGWTSTFLIPLLKKEKVALAATTTNGRDGTIPFKYDAESSDPAPYRLLPAARTVLITFPLKGKGQSKQLTDLYKSTHSNQHAGAGESSSAGPNFIQLGATFLWNAPSWSDENSTIDKENARGIAEDELMEVANGCALDLAGLYGGARQPSGWLDRVIKSKEDLENKGSLHLVHGHDVARAILALHRNFTPAKRWLLTDLHVYDWWDLVQDWASQAQRRADEGLLTDQAEIAKWHGHAKWVGELMEEKGVRALPREKSELGRVLDSRGFWKAMGVYPVQGRVR